MPLTFPFDPRGDRAPFSDRNDIGPESISWAPDAAPDYYYGARFRMPVPAGQMQEGSYTPDDSIGEQIRVYDPWDAREQMPTKGVSRSLSSQASRLERQGWSAQSIREVLQKSIHADIEPVPLQPSVVGNIVASSIMTNRARTLMVNRPVAEIRNNTQPQEAYQDETPIPPESKINVNVRDIRPHPSITSRAVGHSLRYGHSF